MLQIFFSALGLAWQAALKETKVKLYVLTVLILEKEYATLFIDVQKLIKLHHISRFNEDFIKNCNEESDEGYFIEVDVQYLKKLHELHNDLPFLPEKMKIRKTGKLVANLHDKTE